MTSSGPPDDDGSVDGALRRVAIRVARMDRLPIPPTEKLTATEKLLAKLALVRFPS